MKEAIILAGGKGTRLKPYTAVIPKPLMPLGDKAIIEIILHQLDKFKFDKVYISLGYLSYMVKVFVQNYSKKYSFELEFTKEEKPLGTAGALSNISPKSEQIVVINGDTLTDLNLVNVLKEHKEKKAAITIASHKRSVNIEYGVLVCNKEMELVDYQEKPVLNYLVSMGIYVVNTNLLQVIPKDTYYDFPTFVTDVKNKKHKIFLYSYEGYWKDLGNLSDINEAVEDYEADPCRFLLEKSESKID